MSAGPTAARVPGTPASAAITNLGCKVNQSEVEAIGRLLRERGMHVGSDASGVDLHVVNTCTVTAEADAKSRAAVRRARRASPDATVFVTGCSASVDPDAYRAVDPSARIVGNDAKGQLAAELTALLDLPDGDAPNGPLAAPLPTIAGPELLSVADGRSAVDRTRAFVKVQDGCSFFCTYCLIPRARGAERSLPPDVVLGDVRRALAAGHREIVLTGINIGTYDGGRSERGYRGAHRGSLLTLAGLVRRILGETEVERLRISSIEPQHVDDELLDAWAVGAPRTMPHFHLPLQSGDDGVLRRMGRRYDTADYAAIVRRARAALPGLAVHADVMAGFPTEGSDAHDRSVAFIRSLDLAGLHVFRYSERPGTAAVRMTGAVDPAERRRRSADLLALASEARVSFAQRAIGGDRRVLFEERDDAGRWVGRSEDYVAVAVEHEASLGNTVRTVRLQTVDPDHPDTILGTLRAAA